MRAAWQAWEAQQLPLLRMEKPGLKQSQYRDMLWKQVRGFMCVWVHHVGVGLGASRDAHHNVVVGVV